MSTSCFQTDIGEVSKVSSSLIRFLWKIDDFFELQLNVDRHLISPEFQFAGANWSLFMFPKGTTETAGWAELWLIKRNIDSLNVAFHWEIGIKSHDDTTYKSHEGEQKLGENSSRCGEIMLVEYSELFANRDGIAPHGVLTAFCELRLKKEAEIEASCQTDPQRSADKMVQDFKELMLSGDGSDVIINVKNRKFKAHKAILGARSRVFAAMFKKEWTEGITGDVVIKECESDIFCKFLHYIYTGTLQELSADSVIKLYIVAEKYNVDELQADCVDYMRNTLCVDNFCDVLIIALDYQEKDLKKLAINFFVQNCSRILKTNKWQIFLENNPSVSNELLIKAHG